MSTTMPFVYEGERTREISFPLGGIGTGSIGLSGAGRLIDWEILNRPNKGSTNGISHFSVRAERDGKVLDTRIMNGPYRGSRTGDFTTDFGRNFGFGVRRDLAGRHAAFLRLPVRGPLSGRAAGLRRRALPGRGDDDRIQSVHPAERSRLLDPRRDVRVRAVQHHRCADRLQRHRRAGAWAGATDQRAAADGTAAARDRDRGSRSRSAGLCSELVLATDAPSTSRQTYLYRGLWFDALEVYWQDVQRAGLLRDRRYAASDRAGGMRRDRDCSLQAAHVTVAPGRDRPRALRHQLVRAEFQQILGICGMAFPPALRRLRQLEELVCNAVVRRRGDRHRGTARLGPPGGRNHHVPRCALRLEPAARGAGRRGGQSQHPQEFRPQSG